VKNKKKAKKSGSAVVALVLVILLAAAGVGLLHVRGEISHALAEEAALSAQVQQRKDDNAALRSDLDRAEDPDFYKELARSELGLAEEGERIFYDVNH
jgi:cell division protein FtsB